MTAADVIHELIRRWNAGDVDGALELYTEDAVSLPGPEWPEQTTHRGHDELRANMTDWLSAWDFSQIELRELEIFGDRVVIDGFWTTRGRSSGVEGLMPFVALLTLRDGKIARFEWAADRETAVAAARRD